MKATSRLAALLVLAIALPSLHCAAEPLYQVLELGVYEADGLNDSGQVVGLIDRTPETFGYKTSPNSPINLATDSLFGLTFAINASGQVTGKGDGDNGPTVWSPSFPFPGYVSLTPPGYRPDGVGFAINDRGQVGGVFNGSAFRTAPNAAINPATDIFGPGWTNGLNSLGQAVGVISGTTDQAFRTAPNSPLNPVTDYFGTLGGRNSMAMAINSSGQVVGSADTDFSFAFPPNSINVDGHPHAFLSTANGVAPLIHDLGTLGGSASWATAINEHGDMVGYSTLAGDLENHAFVYLDGAMRDINDLIGGAAPVFDIVSASGINNHGQIIVRAGLRIPGLPPQYFPQEALLLTPIPEPNTFLLAACGFMGLAWRLRRRKR